MSESTSPYPPVRHDTSAEYWKTAHTLLALCCECGNQRTVKNGGPRNYSAPGFVGEPWRDDDFNRFICTIKCSVCNTKTTHAMLRREDDPSRDVAEYENAPLMLNAEGDVG
ncbi:DUF6315 family protein [Rhodococcus pyridinivorans]|uniref:DUF6315 family protein n=1 Tax=Rhodococcus pyridinivorans TaxID=103816 RepID=UPI003D7F2D1A